MENAYLAKTTESEGKLQHIPKGTYPRPEKPSVYEGNPGNIFSLGYLGYVDPASVAIFLD